MGGRVVITSPSPEPRNISKETENLLACSRGGLVPTTHAAQKVGELQGHSLQARVEPRT